MKRTNEMKHAGAPSGSSIGQVPPNRHGWFLKRRYRVGAIEAELPVFDPPPPAVFVATPEQVDEWQHKRSAPTQPEDWQTWLHREIARLAPLYGWIVTAPTPAPWYVRFWRWLRATKPRLLP